MEILALRFNNLGSLAGHWHLDFRLAPFAQQHLFAIVGPTGAGKSTVLDAICLALYHQTPRLGVLSAKDNPLMSRHTAECSAEVVFQIKDQVYRAYWEQRRARKQVAGKLQEPTVELALDSGEIITSRIREKLEQMHALTGLNFQRFTQSVLLAQGGFAAFLMADVNQKAALLEQLTGTEIYSRVSALAYQEYSQRQATIQALATQLDTVVGLSPFEQDNLHAQSAALLSERQCLERQRKGCQAKLTQQAILDEALAHLATTEAAYQDNLTRYSAALPLREQWDRGKTAALLWPMWQDMQLTQQQHDGLVLRLAQTAEGLACTQTELQRAYWQGEAFHQRRLANTAHDLNRIQQQRQRHREAMPEALAYGSLLDRWQDKVTLWHQYDVEHNQIQQALRINQAEVARQQGNEDLLRLEFEAAQQRAEHYLEVLTAASLALSALGCAETLAVPHQALQGLWDRYWQILNQIADLSERIGIQAHAVASCLVECQQEDAACVITQQRWQDAQAFYEAKQTIAQQAQLIQSFEAHRQALEAEQPCPLCGALEHPYSTGLAYGLEAGFEADVQLALDRKVQAYQYHTAAQHARQVAHDRYLTLGMQQQITQQEYDSAVASWREIQQDLGLSGDVATALAGLAGDPPSLPALEALIAQRAAYADQQRLVGQHEVQLNQAQQDLKAHESAYLKAQHDKRLAAQEGVHLAASMVHVADQCAALLAELTPQWVAFGLAPCLDLAWYGQQHMVWQQWQAAQVQHAHYEAQLQHLTHQHSEQQQAYAQWQTAVSRYGIDQGDAALVDEAVACPDVVPILEQVTALRAQAGEQQRQLEVAVAAAVRAQQCWEMALTEHGFEDTAAWQGHYLTPALLLACEQDCLRYERVYHESRLAYQLAQAQVAALPCPEVANLEELRIELEAMEERLHGVAVRWGEIQSQLHHAAVQDLAHQALRAQCVSLTEAAASWGVLNSLMGSKDGDKFRRFAQGLTLDHLLHKANQRLGQLFERYWLKRHAQLELTIVVVDTWQADAERDIKTLSGGETFIISLALALGLSDLVSHRLSINSLFLDEGFGSLDAQTLETVLGALDNLQASGKRVGIISHVEALKEVIPLQVKISPLSGGRSRLDVQLN